MRLERLHGWVLPVVLAVLAADVNFFLYAAIGDPGDDVGIALFALLGLYGLQSLTARREIPVVVLTIASAVGLGLMVLRETDVFDRGYILPYAAFIAVALVGHAIAPRRPPVAPPSEHVTEEPSPKPRTAP